MKKNIKKTAEKIHAYKLENGIMLKTQCFDISRNKNDLELLIDVSCNEQKYNGMQIFFSEGIYEVSEMVPDTHINVFCETKRLKKALKHLFLGNDQKIIKVIQTK